MAVSWNRLYGDVCSWENLLLAWRRCRRRKRYSESAAEFAFDWESRLLEIQRQLKLLTWRPGPYHHFHISDPKPRRISPNLAESQAVIFVGLYGDLQGFRDGILHAQMQQSGYAGLLRR